MPSVLNDHNINVHSVPSSLQWGAAFSMNQFHGNGSSRAFPTIMDDAQGTSEHPRKHPCFLCQKRKVKCDRNDPCANCTKARVEYVSATTIPPRRRKKRFLEAEPLARLRRYEEHLKRYGADIDEINKEENVLAGPAEKRERHFRRDLHVPEGMSPLSARTSLKHAEKWETQSKFLHAFADTCSTTWADMNAEIGKIHDAPFMGLLLSHLLNIETDQHAN